MGILIGILGCGPGVAPVTTVPETITPQSRFPGDLARSLSQRADRFRSLRALAKVRYWSKEEKGAFQEAVLIHRPDRMRLETFSPLGALLIVTVDANEVTGYHLRQGLFYRGRNSKENLLRYTRIPLELKEITALLLGLPPVELRGRWKREGNTLYRENKTGGSEAVTFHPTLNIPILWERSDPESELELNASFSDFYSTPAGAFPLKIALEASNDEERRYEILYQEPEVNVSLPASLFAQKKPDHVKELPLESLGG